MKEEDMTNLYDAMNEQMNFELESAYIYKTMTAYLMDLNLDGMAHFMEVQENEELLHAEDFKNALQSFGYKVKYRPIDPGKGEFESVLDVFKKALEHEKLVSKRIRDLYDLSLEQKDIAAQVFLFKYISEQIEEEDNFTKLVSRLERVSHDWTGLYQMDEVLAKRPKAGSSES